ncbi:MAG: DUF1289 domain-containing protein [Stagnimonas sp.]|nr:DUF1289 domain-containing protein [Stagnimonas sp.]
MAVDNSLPGPEPASPCVGICQLDGALCIGCGRLIGEIAGWGSASPGAKTLIVAAARERLAIIASAAVPPSNARPEHP